MADEAPTTERNGTGEQPVLRSEIADPFAALPDDPVAEVTRVEFPVTLRGYERGAVDAYVRRVAERVGGEVGEILKRAHATAEDVTSKSRAEAEERLRSSREESEATLRSARSEAEQTLSSARADSERTLSSARAEAEQTVTSARAEAEEMLSGARATAEELRGRARADVEEILAEGRKRVKELDADADRVWAERRRIVEDVRYLAGQLSALAESASKRFPAEDTGESPAVAVFAPVQPAEQLGDDVDDVTPTRVLRAVAPPDDDAATVVDDAATVVDDAATVVDDAGQPDAGAAPAAPDGPDPESAPAE